MLTITPGNFRTFKEIYLGQIRCGRLELIEFDVTMATDV